MFVKLAVLLQTAQGTSKITLPWSMSQVMHQTSQNTWILGFMTLFNVDQTVDQMSQNQVVGLEFHTEWEN